MIKTFEDPVILLLGSNTGDREANLAFARNEIGKIFSHKLAFSRICITPPWGFEAEQDFFNQIVVASELNIHPEELLSQLLLIEQQAGRVREEGKGYQSRSLDIDILYIGHLQYKSESLEIPHPRTAFRRFALAPLAELLPHFVDPFWQKSIEELLENCEDSSPISWKSEG
jgi:deoxyguanosine kinase